MFFGNLPNSPDILWEIPPHSDICWYNTPQPSISPLHLPFFPYKFHCSPFLLPLHSMASIQIPIAVHESVVAVGTLRGPAPVVFSWLPSSRPLRLVVRFTSILLWSLPWKCSQNTDDNRLVAPFAYVAPEVWSFLCHLCERTTYNYTLAVSNRALFRRKWAHILWKYFHGTWTNHSIDTSGAQLVLAIFFQIIVEAKTLYCSVGPKQLYVLQLPLVLYVSLHTITTLDSTLSRSHLKLELVLSLILMALRLIEFRILSAYFMS